MSSSLLYTNSDLTIVLIDVPHSIERVQGFATSQSPRIISSVPVDEPFPSLEPKSAKAQRLVQNIAPSLDDLLTQKVLSLSVEDLKREYSRPWCLPRITYDVKRQDDRASGVDRKRKRLEEELSTPPLTRLAMLDGNTERDGVIVEHDTKPGIFFYQNVSSRCTIFTSCEGKESYFPPKSTALCGSIESSVQSFMLAAPKFNIIVLDPPWPNRSARRKASYGTAYDTSGIHSLLHQLPFTSTLADDGITAIWITNKPAFREMVLSSDGLFASWGVQLIEEWFWLKTTTSGCPVSAIDGIWRKPYEVLLVGRRSQNCRVTVKRVIAGVSDLHSRKANLKEMFERVFGFQTGKYAGLEVFARNLTAGWWAWGDECLKFQGTEHWTESPGQEETEAVE